MKNLQIIKPTNNARPGNRYANYLSVSPKLKRVNFTEAVCSNLEIDLVDIDKRRVQFMWDAEERRFYLRVAPAKASPQDCFLLTKSGVVRDDALVNRLCVAYQNNDELAGEPQTFRLQLKPVNIDGHMMCRLERI